MKLTIYTDGGSRGNPGQGAIGVVIKSNDETVTEFGKPIGIVTNNEAEYMAVIEALKEVSVFDYKSTQIDFIMDSKLVCEQLSGNWKIKKDHLKKLFSEVKKLELELAVPISYTHVLRDKNKRADELLNEALDKS